MSGFEVTWDTKDWDSKINKLQGKTDDMGNRAISIVADGILEKAEPYTPFDTGNLMRTGVAKKKGNLHYEVGYHTPYALRLHEHPEYKFGTRYHPQAQGKYLERPIFENMGLWKKMLGDKIKIELTNI